MRRILNFQSSHITFASGGKASVLAMVAIAVVTFCSAARAQSRYGTSPQLAPTASAISDNPVSSAVAMETVQFGGEQYRTVPASAVSADYSVLDGEAGSKVELASARDTIRKRRQNFHCPQPQNPCYAGCDVTFYARYESMWLDREGDDFFSLSRNSFLSDFEYEWAGRYTVGHLSDCVNGWEASYVGPFDWQRGNVVTGTNLQSNLSTPPPAGGYTAADIDAFNNATTHSQNWRAQLNSFELNRRWWVWDVLSTMIGVRYIDYEEDFSFFSSGSTAAGGSGLLLESVDNEMIGVQIGGDLMYPMSLRSNVGFKGKAGVYANFAERRAFLNNAGTLLINAGDSDTDVAGLLEFGVFTNYHIVPSIRLTAGYEFWWMPGMATIPEQQPGIITPATGTTVFLDDDVFLHGASVGAEILF